MAITRIKLMTESLRNVASRKGEFGRGSLCAHQLYYPQYRTTLQQPCCPWAWRLTAVLFQIWEIGAECSSS